MIAGDKNPLLVTMLLLDWEVNGFREDDEEDELNDGDDEKESKLMGAGTDSSTV